MLIYLFIVWQKTNSSNNSNDASWREMRLDGAGAKKARHP